MGAHGMCSAQPPPWGCDSDGGVFSLCLPLNAGGVGGSLPLLRKCR